MIKSSAILLKFVAMLELTNRNSSNQLNEWKYDQIANEYLTKVIFIKRKSKLQTKSLLAVESILLKEAMGNSKLVANSLRSMLNGLPAIAPLEIKNLFF